MSNSTSLPALERRLDRHSWRTVVVVEYLSVFEKLAAIDHAAERGRIEELVVDAVLLARPLGARGARHAELDMEIVVQQST